MHRFFVPAETLKGGAVSVSGPVANQMRKVLRLRPGEHIILLDNSGWEVEAEIVALDDTTLQATVLHKRLGTGEPRTKITLYQSLLKGDHLSEVLQKCTEIGVVEFVPVVAERCIVGDVDQASERVHRWERIICEAAEQSQRSKLPVLRPAALLTIALEAAKGRGLSMIPWEEEHTATVRSVLASHPAPAARPASPKTDKAGASGARRPFALNIFIGPEGGFTSNEIAVARQHGIMPVTLGPRILRADTAGLVAAAIILHELGDMV
jgi:16S rRNA (uracil1498-N3)-methyltransferase